MLALGKDASETYSRENIPSEDNELWNLNYNVVR
jgi:hypothetical protein